MTVKIGKCLERSSFVMRQFFPLGKDESMEFPLIIVFLMFIRFQSFLIKYTGYQLLIQPKLVDSCSHMTLIHEKTLLIQPNFSLSTRRKNVFDPLSLLKNNFDWLLEENTFDWLSLLKKTLLIRIKYVFSTRRQFFEEKLGWIKSVFSCISVT